MERERELSKSVHRRCHADVTRRRRPTFGLQKVGSCQQAKGFLAIKTLLHTVLTIMNIRPTKKSCTPSMLFWQPDLI
jgi:hypothetical protein